MALWLEIVRILLGVLILLAISTLYGLFKNTRIIRELHILSAGFLLYTIRGAFRIANLQTESYPMLWNSVSLDDFLTALSFLLFAYAVVRLQKIINIISVENKFVKSLHELFG
ncbi:MAG: hypothetical protein ABH863_01490 [Candidatus Micrarchaeota archaeon]